ncbi:hypothetical protein LshimejAT787_0700190 [Lyophyllum shimeji]|uniref:Uncharacterized protein n=1 Tax=Lyophyllum shimeji TaxID=47721 RepID=A0A9P3PQ53_LYOSH|nr:hypothetical protein LshimejAT787_0700190 [Lyophyllum shimeji]
MKFFSASLVVLPVVLSSMSATATPGRRGGYDTPVKQRDLARLTASNLAARHAAEWDIFERGPGSHSAIPVRRKVCVTHRNCSGMSLCINGYCR